MAWLTAEQALLALGTKPQSLYASVSRGRIRMRADPHDARKSLYDGDDIERLANRGAGRRKAITVAADAIRWGDPVLPSALTTIAVGRLYYRGRDVAALAETATLEEIATLLWQMESVSFAGDAVSESAASSPLARAFIAIAGRAAADPPSLGQTLPSLQQDAAGIVGTLALAIGVAPGIALHRRLAAAWRRPEAANLLRRALVLLADHELNASAFAARVTVSTGASLSAAVLSGLATLGGPLHGGAPSRIARLVEEGRRDGMAFVAVRHARSKALPGFGHRLYPEGDIRAAALLVYLPLPPLYAAYAEAGRDLTGEAPNIDFALAALAAAYQLPSEAPLLLFALARSVGWLAHALEQAATGSLIRPRAHYIGDEPGS